MIAHNLICCFSEEPMTRSPRLEVGRTKKPEPTLSFEKYVFPFVRSRTCRTCHVTYLSNVASLIVVIYLLMVVFDQRTPSPVFRTWPLDAAAMTSDDNV
jgi:hypothetical protein